MSVNRPLSITLPAVLVGLCLSTVSSGAMAVDAEAIAKQGYGWGLGLAVATQRPYKGINQKAQRLPPDQFRERV